MKNVPHNSFILLLQRLQKESEGRAGRWLTHRESSASSFTSWTVHQQRHSSRIFACVHREQTRLFSECSGNVHKRKRREGRRLYLDVWIVEKSEERICFIAFLLFSESGLENMCWLNVFAFAATKKRLEMIWCIVKNIQLCNIYKWWHNEVLRLDNIQRFHAFNNPTARIVLSVSAKKHRSVKTFFLNLSPQTRLEIILKFLKVSCKYPTMLTIR